MLAETAGRSSPVGGQLWPEGRLSGAMREIVEQNTNGSGDDSDF
jgi:hypothetical protein